jgi:phosphoenolpyruvate phosphomutase
VQPAALVVERLRQYISAGADAVFVQTDGRAVGAFREVLGQIRGTVPIMVSPTKLAGLSAHDLSASGADIVIYSNVAIRGMTLAVERLFRDLITGKTLADIEEHLAPLEEVFDLVAAVRR